MTVDVNLLEIIVSMILPLIVGVVVKQVAHPAVKSITLAVLAALTAVLTAGLSSGGEIGTSTIAQAVLSFIIAVGTYYGFWKPAGISQTVNTATENFGITVKKEF
jgi:hypothetical protein